MGNVTKRLLLMSFLVFFGLAVQAQSAWASDTDCTGAGCTFFSGLVASAGPTAVGPSAVWTGSFSENVYLSSGVYTYVFDLSLSAMKTGDSISSISTGLGASVADF